MNGPPQPSDPGTWVGDAEPDCPYCGGTGLTTQTYEPTTNTWDAIECPCTLRTEP
jgi:hypothetical protein